MALSETSTEDLAEHKNEIKQDPKKDVSKANSTLYAENATDPAYVRRSIEDPEGGRQDLGKSTVTEMIDYYTARTKGQRPHLCNVYGDAYKTVLLGACFMTLGCYLPGAFKNLLREIAPKVDLMRDALAQIKKALGKKGYKDGGPWKFSSASQEDMMCNGGSARDDLIYPRSRVLNTAAPNDSATEDQMAHLEKEQKEGIRDEHAILWALGHRDQKICTGCQKGGHAQLHICGPCKTARYCGRTCQMSDFALHKRVCLTIKEFVTLSKRGKVFVGNRGPIRGMRDALLSSVTDHRRNGVAADGSSLGKSGRKPRALPAPPGMPAVRVEEVDSEGESEGAVEHAIDKVSSAIPGGWGFGV